MGANHEFYVGQEVVIREWHEMTAEFDEDSDGILCHDLYFMREMKELCGQHFTIKKIQGHNVEFTVNVGWGFNIYMIKPVEEIIEDEQEYTLFSQSIESLFAALV